MVCAHDGREINILRTRSCRSSHGFPRAWLTSLGVRMTSAPLDYLRDRSSGDDKTVRIWDTASWLEQASMRTDSPAKACAWLGNSTLAVGGSAGLYLFELLTDALPTDAKHSS
jgi:WD40 repeat protein